MNNAEDNPFHCHFDGDATDKPCTRKSTRCDGRTQKGLCRFEVQNLIYAADEIANGKKAA